MRRLDRGALAGCLVMLAGLFILFLPDFLDRGVVSSFVDWPSAAFVFAGPILVLTAIFGWAAPLDAFFYVFGKRSDSAAARDAAHFFQLWAAFALACGFVATLVGFIVMLTHLDDPSRIGPGMAIALLSQFYGMCVAIGCVICSVIILRRYPDGDAERQMARRTVAGASASVVVGTLSTIIAFGILSLAFANVG